MKLTGGLQSCRCYSILSSSLLRSLPMSPRSVLRCRERASLDSMTRPTTRTTRQVLCNGCAGECGAPVIWAHVTGRWPSSTVAASPPGSAPPARWPPPRPAVRGQPLQHGGRLPTRRCPSSMVAVCPMLWQPHATPKRAMSIADNRLTRRPCSIRCLNEHLRPACLLKRRRKRLKYTYASGPFIPVSGIDEIKVDIACMLEPLCHP